LCRHTTPAPSTDNTDSDSDDPPAVAVVPSPPRLTRTKRGKEPPVETALARTSSDSMPGKTARKEKGPVVSASHTAERPVVSASQTVKGPVVSDVPVPAVSSTVSAAPVAVTSSIDPAVTTILMKLVEEVNTLKEAMHRQQQQAPANIAAVHPSPGLIPANIAAVHPTDHKGLPAAGSGGSAPNITNNYHYHFNTSSGQ